MNCRVHARNPSMQAARCEACDAQHRAFPASWLPLRRIGRNGIVLLGGVELVFLRRVFVAFLAVAGRLFGAGWRAGAVLWAPAGLVGSHVVSLMSLCAAQ
jgi:hypothetical protein